MLTLDYTIKMLNIHERSVTVYICTYYIIFWLYLSTFTLPHSSPFNSLYFILSYRYQCGVPVIIEGETGVGKTALVEMLSKLWNYALLVQWNNQCSRLLDFMRRKLGDISVDVSDNYQACHNLDQAPVLRNNF